MKKVEDNKRLTKIPDDAFFEESFDNADVSKVKDRQIEKKLSDSESGVNNKSQPKKFKRNDSSSCAENELNEAEEHSVELVNSETNSEVQKSDSEKRRARKKALKELMQEKRRFGNKRTEKELPVKKKKTNRTCFNCKKKGHFVADCPLALDMKKDIRICFKCGSPLHTSWNCDANVEGYPYAKCFICKEQGHITRDCPQNEHGTYPKVSE